MTTLARARAHASAATSSSSSSARARGLRVHASPSWWTNRPASSRPGGDSAGSLEDELRAARRARGDAIALGVDYGARRVGLAVSNGGAAPRPLRAIQHRGSATTSATVAEILRVAADECADRIVIGIPVPPGRAAKDRRGRGRGAVQMHVVCERFAGEVADACARSSDETIRATRVYAYDESRTSKEAAERMADGLGVGGGDEGLDSASAAILLERYFDGSHGEAKVVEPKRGGGW